MQTIITKYLPPTNFKGSRIKASCQRGSIIVSLDYSLNADENHIAAANALVAKFVREDAVKYGSKRNPWNFPRVTGELPTGERAHVFLPAQ